MSFVRLSLTLLTLTMACAAPFAASAATAYEDCNRVPEGGPCRVTQDPVPGDCFTPRCFEKTCMLWAPVTTALNCDDRDGNPCTTGQCVPEQGFCQPGAVLNGLTCADTDGDRCTIARCLNGSCSQTSSSLPNGSSCTDSDGNPCTQASCQGGRCNQGVDFPPVPPMDDVANVEVEARVPHVTEVEAYTDCGICCHPQSLEALTPTLDGPARREPNGLYPKRVKFCGTAVKYGVNDENGDPRDIMINIVPKPGFEHFVKGFVNTACTGIDSDHYCAADDADCASRETYCRNLSDTTEGKCIHAEVTPANQFYNEDSLYLPITSSDHSCASSWDCPSYLEPQPSNGHTAREVCVYGVYALDHGPDHRASEHRRMACAAEVGHDRPEIHPFDAVWFRHPNGSPGWVFGVFQDDSNRYSYPHCGDDHNGNRWSDAPRDLTFKFPFQFPRHQTPSKVCVQHVRTLSLYGSPNTVAPLNVTTHLVPGPLSEVHVLRDTAGLPVMEVTEPGGAEGQTQVKIEGCATATEVRGFLTVRVAVGCGTTMNCPGLNDSGDPTSGYYYGEIRFGDDCGP